MVFVLANTLANDLGGMMHKVKEQRLVKRTRIALIIIVVIAFWIAFGARDIITLIIALAGVEIALAPPLLGSFFFKFKPSAVVASMLSGIVWIAFLVFAGWFVEELALGSLLLSGLVLVIAQKTF